MNLARFSNLGMIPDWQFSTDPKINFHLNPHVTYPEGWTQMTVQPVGPYYAPPRIARPQLSGFFDSFGWTYRKPLILGGAAILGLGLLAGAGLLLK